MERIKWGIIGTGNIAHEFASDFKFVETGIVSAVASRSLSKAEQFAREFNIKNAYGSYEALVADDEIDVIYVATPHAFHFENSELVLTAGKAVLCEKPITTNVADCERIGQIAKTQNQYLMEGMWTYFLPAIIKAQEWIANRAIGQLVQIRADFGYRVPYDAESRMYNPKLAGGALLDMGIYPIAMAALFIEGEPLEIKSLRSNAPTGVDEELHIMIDYGNVKASLSTSFRCILSNELRIIGTEGTIVIPFFWRAREAFLYQNESIVDTFKDDRESLGFQYEIEAVNQDLLQGRTESVIMPLSRSIQFQQLMEQVLNC